jgi:hypothetical protein
LREIAENTGLEERLDKLESKKANENEQ